MGKGYIPGRIGGDDKVLARWQKYASDSSYHPTASEKAGGKPQMQGPGATQAIKAALGPITQAQRMT